MTQNSNHSTSNIAPPILTVSQLSQAIKHCLETTFSLIWLQGEVSNCKLHSSGHLYFSLKDANAQINAVMFRPDAIKLKIPLKDGSQIIVRGEINLYPQTGKYQIVVKELRLVGLGELLLKLEELKIKLNKQGWFHKDRKRPLPKLPKRIGIVTSPTGAAIQDILNILTRRFSGIHIIVNPVRVQGEGAAQEIAQAIEQFNHHNLVDVMIVGRGGGSIEDLWAFNEEIVAAAIYNSKIPIISAVGHETDHCIADYVADLRAPTPSAAAELVIAEKAHYLHHLSQMHKRIQQAALHLIRHTRQRLTGLKNHPIMQTPYGLLGPWLQRLDIFEQQLDTSLKQRLTTQRLLLSSKEKHLQLLKPSTRLQLYRQKLLHFDKEMQASWIRQQKIRKQLLLQTSNTLNRTWLAKQHQRRSVFQSEQKWKQLNTCWQGLLLQKRDQFASLKNNLNSLHPKNLLARGYCILFSEKENSAITSVESVQKEQRVQILLSDGNLLATINQVNRQWTQK